MNTYKYMTCGKNGELIQSTATSSGAEEKRKERKEMEAKGYVYCERKVNEQSTAYWFEKPFIYPEGGKWSR